MKMHGFTYWIETFGCQMNVRDSETIAGILLGIGYTPSACPEDADLILYNTCCIRDHAEKRVFGNIGALRERKEANPALTIAVCGCMMQQEEVAKRLFKRFPYVDIVFGTNMLSFLPSYIERANQGERVMAVQKDRIVIEDALPSVRDNAVNAFVNINYGCNNFCSYCIVPYVRGPERSRQPDSIEAEVRSLVDGGYSEITLLGQNVNSYGNDLDGTDFAGLLGRISRIDGLKRIRFMTSHPKDLRPKLIEAMATLPNVCHHVHLPMQSGSDRILHAMNRRYTQADYLAIVEQLHAAMSDVELTTDIIVGFPGETEQDFSETMTLVEQVNFAGAFTFKYSPRKGTKAAVMPDQVDEAVKRERLKRLNDLQAVQSRLNNEKYVGGIGTVHVEGCDERTQPMCYGKYGNFKMVYFPGNADLIGQYVNVRATAVRKNSLLGRMEESTC